MWQWLFRGLPSILCVWITRATAGKSPACLHRRKNQARAGKSAAGFLNRTIRCQAIRCRARRTRPPGRQPGPTPPTDGRPANTVGKPNRKRRFRAIAQARLQALAFKHSKPTQPSPRGRGHITGRFEGGRKKEIHHAWLHSGAGRLSAGFR